MATLLISVILRAHAASISDFRHFNLGPFFPRAVEAFQSGDPLASGFRLLACLPQSDDFTKEFVALPFVDRFIPGLVVWFGAFRFAIGLPNIPWPDHLIWLSSHATTGGMIVTTATLELLPEFMAQERAMAAGLLSGRLKLRPPS